MAHSLIFLSIFLVRTNCQLEKKRTMGNKSDKIEVTKGWPHVETVGHSSTGFGNVTTYKSSWKVILYMTVNSVPTVHLEPDVSCIWVVVDLLKGEVTTLAWVYILVLSIIQCVTQVRLSNLCADSNTSAQNWAYMQSGSCNSTYHGVRRFKMIVHLSYLEQ